MRHSAFRHLFSPLEIGALTTKNRRLMPAVRINFGVDGKGRVTDPLNTCFKAGAAGAGWA